MVADIYIHCVYLKNLRLSEIIFVTSLFACLQGTFYLSKQEITTVVNFYFSSRNNRFKKVISTVTILSPHWIVSCSCRFCVKMYKCVFSAFKQWSQQNFLNVLDLRKPISSFPLRLSLRQLYLTSGLTRTWWVTQLKCPCSPGPAEPSVMKRCSVLDRNLLTSSIVIFV